MQTKRMNSVLKEVLEKVKPSKKELESIETSLKDFLKRLQEKIKKNNIKAEIFIGGSFAKNTMIKKGSYDVDIFLRFDKSYKEKEISDLTGKILKNFRNVKVLHGSRDYFRAKIKPNLFFEIIPVIKVGNPKEAKNITDLSYFHVKYIKKKIESKKITDDILLAKKFCYANKCYGAESYITGFSGYALELLIYHYKSFSKFIEEIAETKEKIVIDIERHYRNKHRIMMDLNSSKLHSPIILIDPTYKYRNALAALSEETFEKFKKACKRFRDNPNTSAFDVKKIDLKKIKENASEKKFELHERAFLLEQKIKFNDSGEDIGTFSLEGKEYRRLEDKIFFLISKFSSKKEKDLKGKNLWQDFQEFKTLRDNILHPRTDKAIEININTVKKHIETSKCLIELISEHLWGKKVEF